MALALRRKTHESIVYIDKDSAPRIMPNGEDFILEDIPIGTRVIYPNPPIKGLPNREAAIRYAVNHPLEMEPLYALLEPGMRVTIAMDDISLPLPPMATPDMRQTMLEVVLDMCGANGVDDIHLIIANSLHRKMTEWEMKRMVGSDDLQRILSRPLLQPRRRGRRRARHARPHATQRAASREQTRDRKRPAHLSATSISSRWTAGINRSRSGLCDYESCVPITNRRRSAIRIRTWTRRRRS